MPPARRPRVTPEAHHDRVRVKVCGLTRAADAVACVRLGVWGVGVVLWPSSARAVSPARAARVLASVPEGVARVGVFVDAAPADLARAARVAGLTHLQLHGRCDVDGARAATGLRVIEVVPIDGPAALARARASAADLVLLDAAVPGHHGGTGRAFDWSLLEAEPLGRPFGLAGGLRAESVGDALRRLHPSLLDVSSGVESAPGRKDPVRVAAFLAACVSGTASVA